MNFFKSKEQERLEELEEKVNKLYKTISSLKDTAREIKDMNKNLNKILLVAVVIIPVLTTIANQISREILQKDEHILVPIAPEEIIKKSNPSGCVLNRREGYCNNILRSSSYLSTFLIIRSIITVLYFP